MGPGGAAAQCSEIKLAAGSGSRGITFPCGRTSGVEIQYLLDSKGAVPKQVARALLQKEKTVNTS